MSRLRRAARSLGRGFEIVAPPLAGVIMGILFWWVVHQFAPSDLEVTLMALISCIGLGVFSLFQVVRLTRGVDRHDTLRDEAFRTLLADGVDPAKACLSVAAHFAWLTEPGDRLVHRLVVVPGVETPAPEGDLRRVVADELRRIADELDTSSTREEPT